MTKLYLSSIEHYEPDIIHVFISNGDDNISNIERKVWDSVKSGMGCKNVVEHIVDTSDYERILGAIIGIKKDLQNRYGSDLDIYINISSGTPEFSAAGMFASMLPQPAIAFRVGTESNLDTEELEDIMQRLNGSITVSEPERVTGLGNEDPADEMISFLNIVRDILKETKYPKYRMIIDRLKEAGSWSYDPERKSGYGRTSLEEREERYLKRHYIATALESGWLERPSANTMRVTPSGMAYVSVYGTDGDHRERINECKVECRASLRDCLYSDLDCLSYDDHDVLSLPDDDTVTIGLGDKSYTFRIGTDQHR